MRGKPLVRRWPRASLRHLRRKQRVIMAIRPTEVARKTAANSTNRIVPSSVQLGTFRLPWLRFLRDFSSVARRMPGYNVRCKDGAQPAFPLSHGDLTNVPAHHRAPTVATMPLWLQIPENFPTKTCPPTSVFNKVRPPVWPIVVLNRDVNPLAQAQSLL